jgi:CheY-like chemotaxis protein
MDNKQIRYRILIVDDIPSNVTIVGNFLKSDFAIRVATSAPEALKIIRSDWRPDLVLLDIVMPGMDGVELCKIIRDDLNLKEIPVIFVTANTDDEVLAGAFEAGGNDYIRKPVNKVELTTRIKAIFDQKKLAEAQRAEEKLTGALEMAGAVCHEMGQPLQSILTCAEILMQEFAQEDKQHNLAKMIAEQSKSMAEISKKLQKITSYSTKKYLGNTRIIDLDKSSSQ